MLTASVALATLVWAVFLVWYTVRAKWWRKEYGRNLFSVAFLVLLILSRILASRLWPNFQELEFIGVVVYMYAAFLGVRSTYLMERAQRGS